MIPGNHLEDNRYMSADPKTIKQYEQELSGEIVSLSTPRLNAIEKLYVRVYLNTLSHPKAYEAVKPGLKSYPSDNQFSRKDAVQYHISLGLQDKADAFGLSADIIIEKLYKEATREGSGSNHAARITALTQLGKHFGLFQEKKEAIGHTFNIINYSSNPDISKIEEIEETKINDPEEIIEMSNIILTNYEEG